jgi:hypothetical protein
VSDLTFEDTLSHLLGWISRDVRLVVTPQPGAMHVAGMWGRLRLGRSAPAEMQPFFGSVRAEDTFFMVVDGGGGEGAGRDNYFVIPKDEFSRASIATDTTDGAEILHIFLRGVAVSIRPVEAAPS